MSVDSSWDPYGPSAVVLPFNGNVTDPDYWRNLLPGLTLDDRVVPDPSWAEGISLNDVCPEAMQSLVKDGYFAAKEALSELRVEPLRAAIRSLHDRSLAYQSIWMFNETLDLFAGIAKIIEPVIGGPCSINPLGYDAFCIPVGSSYRGLGPHRDNAGFDPFVAEGRPSVLNIWVALSEANTSNSCIQLVPASVDPGYGTRSPPDEARLLGDVRAVPVPVGSIMGWTSHLLHWGGRSTDFGSEPRVAVAAFVQRNESVAAGEGHSLGQLVPFTTRLTWLASRIDNKRVLSYPE